MNPQIDYSILFQLATGKPENIPAGSFIKNISFPEDELKEIDVILIGLPDNDDGISYEAADSVRNQLYRLSSLTKNLNILDIGNFITGGKISETNERLRYIVEQILDTSVKLVFLGKTAIFNSLISNCFINKKIPLNQVWIDSTISWEHFLIDPLSKDPLESTLESGNNFINIGYQSYFTEKELLDFITDANYESYRLGLVRNKIQDYEPVLRDSNFVNISLNSVKYSDSPASISTSPNGLSGDEVCQLAFYAGYGNRLNIFSVYDFNPVLDNRNISAMLMAQVIWHFLEGLAVRVIEDPAIFEEGFSKYHIHLNISNQNIAFYQSNLTNRWWMEIEFEKPKRAILLSCSEKDYNIACQQEIPDRAWKLMNRL
jgi:formiminoglutamase